MAQWNQVKKGGHTPQALLDKPELKQELVYLWNLYIEIKNGCDRVGFVEIKAYQELMGHLNCNEVDTMIKLDLLRLQNAN